MLKNKKKFQKMNYRISCFKSCKARFKFLVTIQNFTKVISVFIVYSYKNITIIIKIALNKYLIIKCIIFILLNIG